MSEKNIPSRITHKHDTEANWLKATKFAPKHGELIIYDADSTHQFVRLKMGDGTTLINDLPFIRSIFDGDGNIIADTYATVEHVDTLVGDIETLLAAI